MVSAQRIDRLKVYLALVVVVVVIVVVVAAANYNCNRPFLSRWTLEPNRATVHNMVAN